MVKRRHPENAGKPGRPPDIPVKAMLLALAAIWAGFIWPTTHAAAQEATRVELAKAPMSEVSTLAKAKEPLVEAVPVMVVAAAEDEKVSDPEDADMPVLLLGEVIERAVDHSPGLKALHWQALAIWEQSASVAGYGGLQSELSIMSMATNSPLGVFGNRLSQGRVTQADFDPAALNDPDYLGNTEFKLKLMYPLFDSGRAGLLADALGLASNAVDFDALGAEHQLISQVIEVYFGHALLTDQLVVLGEAEMTVQELLRMIRSFEREGLVTRSDIAAAEVELANVTDELNRARTRLALTETTLAVLIGAESAPFASRVPDIAWLLEVPDLAQVTAEALESRPDLLAMNARIGAAVKQLDEAIKKRNPTVGVFAEAKHSTPGWIDEGQGEASFGAQLMLDLDTNGIVKNEIAQKRAELTSAQWALDQLNEMAEIEVAAAHSEVVMARQSIETFNAQAERARENLRVVRNRYREGLTNYLDLRLALTTHKESALREIKSRHDYLLAYMKLMVAAGLIGSAGDPFLGGAFEDTPALELAGSADMGGSDVEN